MRSKAGGKILKNKCSVVAVVAALFIFWVITFTTILKFIKYQDSLYYFNLENKLIDEGLIDIEEISTVSRRYLGHDPAQYDLITKGYLMQERNHNIPPTQEYLERQKALMERQNAQYKYDEDLETPLIEHPYAPGTIYDHYETLSEKPGFKIWVDQGMLDYPEYSCDAKMLDCHMTCCMQSYCAPHKGLCLNYIRRPYYEIYIGIGLVTMIVVGVPTCILTLEFCLNFKFCQTLDEENDCQTGGMTLCEAITYALTCGQAFESRNVFNMDNYEFTDIVIETDQFNEFNQQVAGLKKEIGGKVELEIGKQMNDGKQTNPNESILEQPEEDEALILNAPAAVPQPIQANKRNCFTRIFCLICCCDTGSIGSSSHLNQINDMEIQLYQQQLRKEIERKKAIKQSMVTEILPPSQQAEEEVKENELPIHDEKPAMPSNGSDAGSKKTDIK